VAEQTNEQKLREIEKLCGKVALPGVPELTADELRQLQSKQEIVLVDVHSRKFDLTADGYEPVR